MDTNRSPRTLTHDEQKAAEAAFGGRPFNPAWSASAKKVYDGLIQAMPASSEPTLPLQQDEPTVHSEDTVEMSAIKPAGPTEGTEVEQPEMERTSVEQSGNDQAQEPAGQAAAKRLEAIRSGFLIDVTADAQKLGLTFPVTVTKPLWDIGIEPTQTLSEQERAERLRDILMAFRLRLAGQTTLSPLIDFPALLSLPPGSMPQAIPLLALIQPDGQNRAMATLLLPNEVSTTIVPLNGSS